MLATVVQSVADTPWYLAAALVSYNTRLYRPVADRLNYSPATHTYRPMSMTTNNAIIGLNGGCREQITYCKLCVIILISEHSCQLDGRRLAQVGGERGEGRCSTAVSSANRCKPSAWRAARCNILTSAINSKARLLHQHRHTSPWNSDAIIRNSIKQESLANAKVSARACMKPMEIYGKSTQGT